MLESIANVIGVVIAAAIIVHRLETTMAEQIENQTKVLEAIMRQRMGEVRTEPRYKRGPGVPNE